MYPPLKLIKKMETVFPRGFKDFKTIYYNRGIRLPEWPDWCYVPAQLIEDNLVIRVGEDINSKEDFYNALKQPILLTAAATWRLTKGIYRFDADVYKELVEQELHGELPTELLMRLPEWCVYIETPGMDNSEGFMAFLNYDLNTERPDLIFIVFTDTDAYPYLMPLGNWNLKEALEISLNRNVEGLQEMQKQIDFKLDSAESFKLNLEKEKDDYVNRINRRLNLLLYLCSNNADIPAIPFQMHGNGTKRMIAAAECRVWDVGIRVGAAIRKYREQEDEEIRQRDNKPHNSPRPHIRRAHWHSFWKGHKSDYAGRELILHWLPPIPVMVGDSELPAVIREVE
jgi:hypothetical protein